MIRKLLWFYGLHKINCQHNLEHVFEIIRWCLFYVHVTHLNFVAKIALAFSIASVAAHARTHFCYVSQCMTTQTLFYSSNFALFGQIWLKINRWQTNKEHSRHHHTTQTKHIISMFCLPSCTAQILEKQADQRMYTQ